MTSKNTHTMPNYTNNTSSSQKVGEWDNYKCTRGRRGAKLEVYGRNNFFYFTQLIHITDKTVYRIQHRNKSYETIGYFGTR